MEFDGTRMFIDRPGQATAQPSGRALTSGRGAPVRSRMGATTVEVTAGHLAMVTHPDTVVELIEQAAETVAG
jgi:hypothetical protein